MRLNVRLVVAFVGYLWFQDETSVALFGSTMIFIFQYKDLVDLTNGSKRIIQKYEEMRDFSDVRKIIKKMAIKDDFGDQTQVPGSFSWIFLKSKIQSLVKTEILVNIEICEKTTAKKIVKFRSLTFHFY